MTKLELTLMAFVKSIDEELSVTFDTNDGYCYNISYFSLVGLRLLAKYDTEHSVKWNEVLAASKAYMKKVQDASYGLWPDWSDANGNPISPENSNNPSSTSALYDYFGDKAKVSFGIGTFCSNDTFAEPLNIVIKLQTVNGRAVAKLSDSDGKTMCRDPQYLEYLKRSVAFRLDREKNVGIN